MAAPTAPSLPHPTSPPTAPAAPFPLFRLLVITGAIFVSVTSEFLPTGLLPDMAADLGVSESRIGLLVTAFAATVVLTTAPLAVLTRKLSRKRLMVALLLGFAVANVLAALAPTYEVLFGARVLGGLAHGLFWAVTGPYASHLVPRHQLARAVAVTSIGATAAFVAGVPLGTALGHALGWRVSFAVMAGVVLIFTVLVIKFLPPVAHRDHEVASVVPDPVRRDPTIRLVIIVCLIVILFASGQNVFYTYIAPWMIQIAGFSADAVSPLLFAYGAAGVVGLILAGAFVDRFPRPWTIGIVILGGVAVAALAWVSSMSWAVVLMFLLWSLSFSGFPAVMQARLLKAASPRVRDIASASLTTSFNLAIGGGALLGGVVLDRWGIHLLPWVQVALISVTLAFILIFDRPKPDPAGVTDSPTDRARRRATRRTREPVGREIGQG